MYKLIILFQPPTDHLQFEQDWMKFLGIAEDMPGLRLETVSQVRDMTYGRGEGTFFKVQELYFDTRDDLEKALRSRPGQAAGKFLIQFTHGRVTVLVAEHMQATPKEFASQAREST